MIKKHYSVAVEHEKMLSQFYLVFAFPLSYFTLGVVFWHRLVAFKIFGTKIFEEKCA